VKKEDERKKERKTKKTFPAKGRYLPILHISDSLMQSILLIELNK
jgi:hypothetical protein